MRCGDRPQRVAEQRRCRRALGIWDSEKGTTEGERGSGASVRRRGQAHIRSGKKVMVRVKAGGRNPIQGSGGESLGGLGQSKQMNPKKKYKTILAAERNYIHWMYFLCWIVLPPCLLTCSAIISPSWWSHTRVGPHQAAWQAAVA